jgi:hypothetical protein
MCGRRRTSKVRAQEDAQKKSETQGRVLDRWIKRVNECRPQSLKVIQGSFQRAEAALETAEKAEHEAKEDMLIACIEALQAENELLRCEKAASDARVQEMLAL